MTQAFSNIRILDFSQIVAGPFAAQMFNLLGAEVIKVEQPGKGDQMRSLFALGDDSLDGQSPGFMSSNFGKKSIAINLKAPDAHEVIMKIAASADVVVQSFRAGVIDKLGFGYDEIRKVKPDIVYCSISGYGLEGPNAGKPAYDGAIQAASGMMANTGHPETGPVRATYLPVDTSTGLTAAFAIAAALFRRNVTGEGQHLDVAMLDAAISLQAGHFTRRMLGGEEPGLQGNKSPTKLPTADCFETTDGYLLILALNEKQVQELFGCIGISEILDDPRFTDNASRAANADAALVAIRAAIKHQSSDYWLEKLETANVPVSKIRDIDEVCRDPQLETRNIIVDVPLPGSLDGHVKLIGAAFTANVDGPMVPGAPPTVDQHGDEILRGLGYTDDEIGGLQLT